MPWNLYKSIAEILFSLRTKVHLKLFSSTPSPHHLGEISFCCTIAQVAFATKLASSPGSEDQARISVVSRHLSQISSTQRTKHNLNCRSGVAIEEPRK
ncbi:hypothetical protein FOBRF1_008103 [Fusarium oxysporum]